LQSLQSHINTATPPWSDWWVAAQVGSRKDCANLQWQKVERMIKHTEENHIIEKVAIHYYHVVTVTSLCFLLINQLWPQMYTNSGTV